MGYTIENLPIQIKESALDNALGSMLRDEQYTLREQYNALLIAEGAGNGWKQAHRYVDITDENDGKTVDEVLEFIKAEENNLLSFAAMAINIINQ